MRAFATIFNKRPVLFMVVMLIAASAMAQSDTLFRIVPGKVNATKQQSKPYVILISADGFRWDYAEKYQAKNILAMANAGIRAESMIPSFPVATVANHYVLSTGIYPARGGITGNTFYDPARKENFKGSDGTWYMKEPIWVTAEKQGMLTASFYWIGSDPKINGVQPTYWFKHLKEKTVPAGARQAALKYWLAMPDDKRPHLITMYMNETDHAGHNHGPDSKEAKEAVDYIDDQVGKIMETVKASGLPVNIIFVSDHGMTAIDREHILKIPAQIDTAKFVIVDQGAHVNLYAKDKSAIQPMYQTLKALNEKGYQVYLKKDLPADLHYGAADDKYNRVGDIVLLSKWPQVFAKRTPYGAHGFSAHQVKDMHATFFAWGPQLKSGVRIPSFENVEVYGLMAQLLGIKPLPNDGKGVLVKEAIK